MCRGHDLSFAQLSVLCSVLSTVAEEIAHALGIATAQRKHLACGRRMLMRALPEWCRCRCARICVRPDREWSPRLLSCSSIKLNQHHTVVLHDMSDGVWNPRVFGVGTACTGGIGRTLKRLALGTILVLVGCALCYCTRCTCNNILSVADVYTFQSMIEDS